MRIAAVVALSLCAGVAGCTSAPEYVVTERAELRVDQAIGLTRSEMAERLGLKAQKLRLVYVAALDKEVLVETVRGSEYESEGICPDGQIVAMHWRYGEKSGHYVQGKERWAPAALFRNDRYAGPSVNPTRPNDDTRQPVYIVSTCMTAPHVPDFVHAALYDARQPQPHDVNPTLATLRLGSRPPGGLDAWLANLPADARLQKRDGANADVTVHSQTSASADDSGSRRVKVSIANGVVARLESGLLTQCELTAERFFRCGYAGVLIR